MLRFKSIMSRIICLHVMAIGITSIFMPAALLWLLNSETNNLHRQAMREQADSIVQHLMVRADGALVLDLPQGLRDPYSKAYGRYAYAILDDAGHVLFSSVNEPLPVFPADPRSADIEFLETRRGEEVMSGASVPKRIADRTVWVEVAENLAHRDVLIDDIVSLFFYRVGWVTIPILLLLLAIDIAIFRRALNPLIHASEQAQTIGPRQTDVRLPVERIPNEVRPLVVAVNRALDRLDEGFRRLRELTADAAHELRTPLAILCMRVDTLADQQVVAALRQDVSGMARIVNQLLEIEELETLLVNENETADLQRACTEVVESIAPLALAQGKDIALGGEDEPVWVRANSEALKRAIRNLVENAVNHTPRGTAVEITVGKTGTVAVLDQGPGVPEEQREVIFQRFWRRDRGSTGGAGLGLSIVRRVVEAHAGTICVTNSPSGGAQFEAKFQLSKLDFLPEGEKVPAR